MPQSHMNTSQANGECPFGLDMVRTWRARCVDIPGGPIQTVCLTFNTPLLHISPRSPRWYRKRSSHIVLRCRQIAYNNH